MKTHFKNSECYKAVLRNYSTKQLYLKKFRSAATAFILKSQKKSKLNIKYAKKNHNDQSGNKLNRIQQTVEKSMKQNFGSLRTSIELIKLQAD